MSFVKKRERYSYIIIFQKWLHHWYLFRQQQQAARGRTNCGEICDHYAANLWRVWWQDCDHYAANLATGVWRGLWPLCCQIGCRDWLWGVCEFCDHYAAKLATREWRVLWPLCCKIVTRLFARLLASFVTIMLRGLMAILLASFVTIMLRGLLARLLASLLASLLARLLASFVTIMLPIWCGCVGKFCDHLCCQVCWRDLLARFVGEIVCRICDHLCCHFECRVAVGLWPLCCRTTSTTFKNASKTLPKWRHTLNQWRWQWRWRWRWQWQWLRRWQF